MTRYTKSAESRIAGFAWRAVALLVAFMLFDSSLESANASDSQRNPVDAQLDRATERQGIAPRVVNDRVNLPKTSDEVARMGPLSMELPVQKGGTDLHESKNTATFAGKVGTAVRVEPHQSGLRALIYIDDASAPEAFEFPIGGNVQRLSLQGDGSVAAYGNQGKVLAIATAPWAVDKNGVNVPTRYEVRGRTTLVQIVEHRDSGYAYGVVADPSWVWWGWNGAKCATSIAAIFTPLGVGKLAGMKRAIKSSKVAKKVISKNGGVKKSFTILWKFCKSRGKKYGPQAKSIFKALGGSFVLTFLGSGCHGIYKEVT